MRDKIFVMYVEDEDDRPGLWCKAPPGSQIILVGADPERFFVPPETDIRRENDIGPGEVLTAVLLPVSAARVRSVYLRQTEKSAFDWPIADVAVVFGVDAQGLCQGARVVLGAAAPVPHRAKAAEQELNGQKVSAQTAARVAHAALAGATPLGQNAYKLHLFEVLVRRALLAA